MAYERSLLWLKPGLIFVVPLVIFGIVMLNRGSGQSTTVLSAWLSPDVPAQISLPLGTASQIYGFSANPGAPTRLLLNSSSPALAFTAEVRSSAGQRVAVLDGGLQNAVLTLGPSDSLYEVEFKPNSQSVSGAVSVMVSDALADSPPISPPADLCSVGSALDAGVNVRIGPGFEYAVLTVLGRGSFLLPDTRSDNGWYRVNVNGQAGWVQGSMVNLYGPCQDLLLSAPVVVPLAASVATSPPVICSVTASANVNIRNGPGTNYTVIGTLPTGTARAVTGHSDSGWYVVEGQQGWVSGSVVTLSGACNDLPLAAPATPLPVAPYDNGTFSLVTDRDGSSQASEVISYPDGDRTDLIQVSVANLFFQPPDNYREFTLTLQCSGAGAENVRWGAPENPVHLCGSAITLPFLYDYSQQFLTITLNQPGYVQYTLVAVRHSTPA